MPAGKAYGEAGRGSDLKWAARVLPPRLVRRMETEA